jgi:hypothetical protein
MQGFSSLGTFRPAVADQRNELGIGVIGCRVELAKAMAYRA